MSSRQLRKLRKKQELLQEPPHHDENKDDSEASEEDEYVNSKPRANAFSAFAALGDDDGGDAEEEEEGHDEPDTRDTGPPAEPAETPAPAKKSKKKAKKKKGKQAQAPPQSPRRPDSRADEPEDGVDEIDRAIKELGLARTRPSQDPIGAHQTFAESSQQLSELLRINYHHLKVVNEMRQLFGKDAIDAARAEEEGSAGPRQATRSRRAARNVDLETFLRGPQDPSAKGISEVLLRKNPFVDGRSYWPRAAAGGLTMTVVGNPHGDLVEFAFSHDNAYDVLEATFFSLVQMYDPMQLVYFLQEHPYHVSTLVQVSKIAKQDQNSALSAELCERALFTLGRVTLSSFRKKLEQGKARLDFHRPENRQFWLAGYHYLKTLVMKGTCRTALEWAKLLLSISTDDPYGIVNWIHVLAVRAREAQWFIDLCETELLKDGGSRQLQTGPYVRQTLVLAKLQLGDASGAEDALVRGIEQLPWLYAALFSALSLDTPRCIWGVQPRGPDEELHTQLYIHVAKDLWDNAQATALLRKAGSVANKPDLGALPDAPLVGLDTARFVYLDNTPSLMAKVPRGLLHANPNFDFDPLPPPRESNIFSRKSQELPWISASFSTSLRPAEGQAPQQQQPPLQIEDHLQELEEAANNEDVPEEARTGLRRFLDLVLPLGLTTRSAPNPDPDAPLPRPPGAWGDDDDDDFEGEDDFGDGLDDDDGLGPREQR